MLRNINTDIVVIKNLPGSITGKEITKLEDDLKWYLQNDANFLTVRYYYIPN